MRDPKPIVEVIFVFLYRDHYSDYYRMFKLIKEPDYKVELATEAAVDVLQLKEWFHWDDDLKLLQALILCQV